MRKNVVHFIGSFHQGGSERQAIQVVRLLIDSGEYNVLVATLNKDGILLGDLERLGFSQIPEFGLTGFFNLRFLKQLFICRKYLRSNEIDIVQTHDFYTNVFGITAAKLAGIPVKIASKRETGDVRTKWQQRVENWIFSLADSIIANSQSVKNYLSKQSIPAPKIRVVHNAVDPARLRAKETSRPAICAGFGLPAEREIKYVTHLANLRHNVKNQEMLLRAAKRLYEEFPEVHYIFAGEGGRIAELSALAAKLEVENTTHFIGGCTTVPELLSITEIGVLTSLAEGFSNSILEYMGAGLPVVATDTGSAGEAVIEGRTGYLVEPDDDEKLADRLAILLKNPDKSKVFGEFGRKTVEERFSLEKQLGNINGLYRELLEKK